MRQRCRCASVELVTLRLCHRPEARRSMYNILDGGQAALTLPAAVTVIKTEVSRKAARLLAGSHVSARNEDGLQGCQL